MPEEMEVPLEQAHEHIHEAHKERFEGEPEGKGKEEKGKDNWTRFIAVVTALLAVIAAIGALKSGLLVNEALLAKNDQVGHLTQASDAWNYYQAKSIKGVVYAATAELLPLGSPAAAKSKAEIARYEQEGKEIQAKAQDLDKQAEENKHEAERDMDRHHIFAFSVSLCQIAIALSAVAALTRNRWVWFFGVTAGIFGTAALVGGFLGLKLPFAF